MNVAQANIKEILDNQEFSDIMASIGLVIGQPPEFKKLRYSQIVFLADSDVDGGHINTLLTNFFYNFWPELFEAKCIQIARAPLFEIITDKGRKFAESPGELEHLKKSGIKIKEIQRNKGLGEMSPEAFKHILARETYTAIEIDDNIAAKGMLEICFGKDSGPRKELLMAPSREDEENINVFFKNKKKTVKKKAASKKTKKKVAKKAKKKKR